MSAHLAVRADHDRVSAALAAAGGDGSRVGPTADRWCGVALPATADGDTLAATLSDALGVPVTHAVSGAQSLDFRLFVYGERVVAYRSADGGAGSQAVERLIDATDARALPDDVARILASAATDPVGSYAELVTALGLPPYLADGWEG